MRWDARSIDIGAAAAVPRGVARQELKAAPLRSEHTARNLPQSVCTMATSPPTSVTASSSPLDVRTSGTDLEGTKYALRWGIIGASNIASDFVKSLGGVPGATVGAVAARNPAKAQAFADTHGIAKIHANYAELVADPDIDIVYVGTITVCHKEHCMLAIEAGKHILCEKPLAASVPDAEEMYAAAAVRGVMLQVRLNS